MPNTIAKPHFDRMAYKVLNKRIFATLHEATNSTNLKLSQIDQSVFCSFNKTMVYAVPNKWGLQGWTTFELDALPEEFVQDALNIAYGEALAPKGK